MGKARHLTAAAAIAAAALTLTACSSDSSGSSNATTPAKPAGSAPAAGGAAAPAAAQPAPAAGARGSYYVALGDSYAAGVMIGETLPDSPKGCLRTAANYAHQLAKALAVPSFTDVTCGGAVTDDFAKAQTFSNSGPSPTPQYDALGPDTKLVTVGIGGNDIGFSQIIGTCAFSSVSSSSKTPCTDVFTKDGQDTLKQRIDTTGGKIDAVLRTVHEKSPDARVLLVGYPAILPETGAGCPDRLPAAAGDLPYLRTVLQNLNGMLKQRAAAGNATYVDTYTPGIGHDVCQAAGTRWIEGLKPEQPAAPVHPNALGQQGMAAAVIATAEKR
ncbi:SGNH/GDSL hydrolase family protein [Yinghuangia seranimata]|uniref:SGNH/GDSL hydrolase family protein n=1 Tax=Yinghuangia seranimata TaxID=408067 RepID=UPI00248CADE0|nr:SGNH/GDSL hydrolase family protein [Yinghuangia seranimata]MDI2128645.1 SGNH/GDSL hydrolase family protein [Yinghuangia seranimata]